MKAKILVGLMALAVCIGLLGVSAPIVEASSKGRKNTTYALGAATIYSLVTGKTTQGLILGAGTALAYKQYSDSKKSASQSALNSSARYYRYR